MQERNDVMPRKVTTFAWVALGLIGGAYIVTSFALGFMSTYQDEAAIDLTKPPVSVDAKAYGDSHTIFVSNNNLIQLDGETVEADILVSKILNIIDESDKPPVFIVRLHESARHKTLVDLKDMLDAHGAKSLVEIIRDKTQ